MQHAALHLAACLIEELAAVEVCHAPRNVRRQPQQGLVPRQQTAHRATAAAAARAAATVVAATVEALPRGGFRLCLLEHVLQGAVGHPLDHEAGQVPAPACADEVHYRGVAQVHHEEHLTAERACVLLGHVEHRLHGAGLPEAIAQEHLAECPRANLRRRGAPSSACEQCVRRRWVRRCNRSEGNKCTWRIKSSTIRSDAAAPKNKGKQRSGCNATHPLHELDVGRREEVLIELRQLAPLVALERVVARRFLAGLVVRHLHAPGAVVKVVEEQALGHDPFQDLNLARGEDPLPSPLPPLQQVVPPRAESEGQGEGQSIGDDEDEAEESLVHARA